MCLDGDGPFPKESKAKLYMGRVIRGFQGYLVAEQFSDS